MTICQQGGFIKNSTDVLCKQSIFCIPSLFWTPKRAIDDTELEDGEIDLSLTQEPGQENHSVWKLGIISIANSTQRSDFLTFAGSTIFLIDFIS